MLCLGGAKLSPRLYLYLPSSIASLTRWTPRRRAFSVKACSHNDLFNYTSGRWLFNDAPRLAERRRVFNVDGLCRLAAQSVNRNSDDIDNLQKLAEGGFNRTFLITMRDGFQMVARIPYPATVPKYFAVASEVATMDLLRSSGLPVPEIYGYSPEPHNAAETEYIFMEFVQGTKLSDIWYDLEDEEIISVVRQLVEFESKMMSISFPAGGSLYYAKDLEKAAGRPGIPLEDARFCVGPDVRIPMWYGRRSQLDVDRGPYESAKEAMISAANKELAYLERFGRPLLPLERMRREAYQYQEQLPSNHIENLNRYLLIAPSIIPQNPALNRFSIRHPDLQPSNIIVSKSAPDSDNLHIVGLIDWQHASILPPFLFASIPKSIENYDDFVSQTMMPPSLPKNFDDLDETKKDYEKELYRRRLVHYHYLKETEKSNAEYHAALTESLIISRVRLFCLASEPWDGETLDLKVELMKATKNWGTLTGADNIPCPIMFDAEDVRQTMELEKVQKEADNNLEVFTDYIGIGPEGWVPAKHYEEAMARSKHMKDAVLEAASSGEERTEILKHWPLNDMDEESYR